MKTSELKDLALDWAAAKAMGVDVELNHGEVVAWKTVAFEEFRFVWKPSTSWLQGGAIIERERITIDARQHGALWVAYSQRVNDDGITGNTPLIAAMRCFVASKLGNEVDLPDEFKQGETA
mgnify:CR=1 FL=1